ncbi:ankyrin repeat domain-containing protein [Hydrogenophaga sp. BPS33]|uniref:ankyrin repeat domain-containing protein n=1 Tax=Hydrogenophaga sp. BPS33 TaxID=2651974 RepID=UPI00131FB5BF|nr:ankyrin repeat domain-containing protein [Hydrogenophaga sp. BPS33]QHE86033.1 ankyrin repeat domain-containing protein [Hydrogenophaga sp. BPS33]
MLSQTSPISKVSPVAPDSPMRHARNKGDADIESVNREGATPFFLAVQHQHAELPRLMLPLLLEKKADVHQPTKDGRRPLHAACLYGDVKTVQWLLTDTPILQSKSENLTLDAVLNQPTLDGRTPLHLAVESMNKRMVQFLLSTAKVLQMSSREDQQQQQRLA